MIRKRFHTIKHIKQNSFKAKPNKQKVNGEQDSHKISLQDLMRQAQKSAEQGTIGSTQETSEALGRVEAVLTKQAKHAPDEKSEKTILDMAKLAGAADDLVVEKDIGDRLQTIAKEARLASKENSYV